VPGASVKSAVAAANYATLAHLVPSQQEAIDTAFQAALALIADGPAKTAGLAVGEQVTEVRTAMGKRIGELAVAKYLRPLNYNAHAGALALEEKPRMHQSPRSCQRSPGLTSQSS
jgi:hypothetical protein